MNHANKRILSFIALMFVVSGVFMPSLSEARTCRLLAEKCVDSGCKTINGFEQCMDCWEYKKTYECITPGVVDYCAPFASISGCYQSSSRCVETSQATGECLKYTQTWHCGDPVSPQPSNTIRLDDTYTLVSSSYDRAPCASQESGFCQIAESKCVSTTPPSLPPGVSPGQVAPDGCYERKDTYACISGDFSSDCSKFANDPNCRLVETTLADGATVIDGKTTATSKRWECMTSPGSERTIQDCSGQSFCMDGNCFDSGFPPDGDMLRVAATMEAARQAGRYFDPSTFTLFRGEPRKCTRKLLINCCDEGSKSTQSNRSVLEEMGMQGASQGASWLGNQAFDMGSKYVYDFMWDSGIFKDFAFDGLADIASNAAMAANFSKVGSFYGVTVWTGTVSSIPAAGGLGTVDALFSAGGFNFGFDPYSLAISLAIQVIMQMMSCDEASIYTATYKETGLCHYLGEYCSADVLGVCYEWKNGYCCFNSKLAKLVNEQGRSQIGKGWGTAKNPDCSGFTPEQFEKLNFEQMDLSEFYAEVVPRDTQAVSGEVNNYMGNRIVEHVNGQ